MYKYSNLDCMIAVKNLYSLEMKAKFICWFENNLEENKENNPEFTTFAHCERKHGIRRKVISSWISKKDKIFCSDYKRNRSKLPNIIPRKSICDAMENQLADWFETKRLENICVDADILKTEARRLYSSIHLSNEPASFQQISICTDPIKPFHASNGWLQNSNSI